MALLRKAIRPLLMILAVSCLACGGEECDDCSKDADCKNGLTCADFEGGHQFCANSSTESCTKTTYYGRAPAPTDAAK